MSRFSSRLESRNNSGSKTLENDSDDIASGERARSIDYYSSAATRNGVVSHSNMVGNGSSMNQETSLEFYGTIEDYDKEEDCSSDDGNRTQLKNTRNKLSVLYKFLRITEYQELKLSSIAKEK